MMKKALALVLVLVMCFAFAAPALAETNDFVPSITYKGIPEIIDAYFVDEDGNVLDDIHECLIVTSITQAEAGENDIEIIVANTLAGMVYQELSTFFQIPRSGLLGPVELVY